MGISLNHAILFLVMSSTLICLSHAGCSGSCSISGGSMSYDFLGDPSFNPSMDTFDNFVRDNSGQNSLSTKSISQNAFSNSSFNPTHQGNISLNSSTTYNITEDTGKTASDSKVVKLGGSGTQDGKLSALAFSIFNNNMI